MARFKQINSSKSRIRRGGALIKNKKDLVTLKGIIIPVDWDHKGNVVAIAISTEGEEEYLICNDNKGKSQFRFIQDFVKVTGIINEVAGIKLMKIEKVEKWDLDVPDEVNKFTPLSM